MVEIPYGQALTYGDVAKTLSSSPTGRRYGLWPQSIPIIIPCHRIMGAKGKLTGYTGAGGTKTKSFLLDLESHQARLPLADKQKAHYENRRANRPTLSGCFTILILDNEVTLDAFITDPPLKWARLINENRAVFNSQKLSHEHDKS